MPWINEEMCTGCGICIEECPVDAISMEDSGFAKINMDECIRCGTCHDICPQEAARHDSEKAPEKIQENVKTAERLLEKCGTKEARIGFLDKLIKSFKLQIRIARESSEKIEELKNKH